MVNSARAGVGASPTQPAPAAFEPPPNLRPPPAAPSRAPRAPPPPPSGTAESIQSRAPRGDGLSSEAEHWRAIRDSKNPADFMDYIARYGAEGAFTEVAELKLKQLTSQSPSASSAAQLRDAARAAAAEPARPASRNYDPPPRRAEAAPSRRPEPPHGANRHSIDPMNARLLRSPREKFRAKAAAGYAC